VLKIEHDRPSHALTPPSVPPTGSTAVCRFTFSAIIPVIAISGSIHHSFLFVFSRGTNPPPIRPVLFSRIIPLRPICGSTLELFLFVPPRINSASANPMNFFLLVCVESKGLVHLI
jgi:hypothetical protein